MRAGHEGLTIARTGIIGQPPALHFSSPAFPAGGRIPERFTADGEGVSPPLVWGAVPDAPAPHPLVHALIWNLPATAGGLAEGAIRADGDGGADGRDVGLNSFMAEGWLPPDPPNGHGEHDYVFQLFALDIATVLEPNPGRAALVEAMRGHVLDVGMLVGTYSRGNARPLIVADPVPVAG